MAKQYELDSTKIMSREERSRLLKTCNEQAELDLMKARTTWPTRKERNLPGPVLWPQGRRNGSTNNR